MRKTTLFILVPLMLMGLSGCVRGETVNNRPTEFVVEEVTPKASSNEFAFTWLQKNVEESPKANVVVSPLGMYRLLGVLYAGSQNQTQEQIASVMGWNGSENACFQMLHEINLRYQNRAEVQLADSVWVQNQFPIDERYLQVLQNIGKTEVQNVDFRDEETVEQINQWVADETKGKIRQLFDNIVSSAELVLCNTLTFSGKWANEFDRKNTRKGYFTSLDGEEVRFPIMQREGFYRYLKGADYQWLEIPYEGDEFFMGIFLPDSYQNFAKAEKQVNERLIRNCMARAYGVKVDVRIPRFSFFGSLKPVEVLQKMGMVDAFTTDADFSSISKRGDLMISQIVQASYLKVDEKGTEAAAATGAEMFRKSLPSRRNPTFYADRPFVFIIAERKTGTILFAGRFVDPEDMEKDMADLQELEDKYSAEDAVQEEAAEIMYESVEDNSDQEGGSSVEGMDSHTSGIGGDIQ